MRLRSSHRLRRESSSRLVEVLRLRLLSLVRLLVVDVVVLERGRVVVSELPLWRGGKPSPSAPLPSGDVLVLRCARVPDQAP
jgi:hypothetical protein